jgi:hypothetical protein
MVRVERSAALRADARHSSSTARVCAILVARVQYADSSARAATPAWKRAARSENPVGMRIVRFPRGELRAERDAGFSGSMRHDGPCRSRSRGAAADASGAISNRARTG